MVRARPPTAAPQLCTQATNVSPLCCYVYSRKLTVTPPRKCFPSSAFRSFHEQWSHAHDAHGTSLAPRYSPVHAYAQAAGPLTPRLNDSCHRPLHNLIFFFSTIVAKARRLGPRPQFATHAPINAPPSSCSMCLPHRCPRHPTQATAAQAFCSCVNGTSPAWPGAKKRGPSSLLQPSPCCWPQGTSPARGPAKLCCGPGPSARVLLPV